MKKHLIILCAALIAAAVCLTSCADFQQAISNMTGGGKATADTSGTVAPSEQATPSATADNVDDSIFDGSDANTGDFVLENSVGNAISAENGVYNITAAGDYTLTGTLENAQIVVNVSDSEKVKLILNGVTMSNAGPSILALSADKVNVECAEGTYNEINDTLATEVSSETENYDAAIYAQCDLDIQGTGTLVVTSAANNGIKTKDDLDVSEVSLKVTAYNNALKGNDSVTIESGEMILTSLSSDAIKTSNTKISSKGNQKGNITILGGKVDIYSAMDGIQAAYDAGISGNAVVNIYTASYASSGETAAASEMYIVIPASYYSDSYDYYAYFYDGETSALVKAEYESPIYSGNKASYAGLTLKVPSGYDNVQFLIVEAGVQPDGDNYVACTEGETLNTAVNGYLFTEISGSAISGDWVSISSGSGGSSTKTTYSSKGVKAGNQINVSGGTITIYCMDDGLHANNDVGTGNINISGGTLTVTAADDGIHADGILSISGGTVNIVESHEGLEGNQVLVSGGSTFVYADDDGVNATAGSSEILVQVSGGYLDVTTASGDTDGIDSNGNYQQTGGFVIVKGGSAQGNMAGSVDTDGTVTVTGGTIVALGGICTTPSNGSVNTYISQGTSFGTGEYEITDSSGNAVITFELTNTFSSVWIASELLTTGETYSLTCSGSQLLNWTQDSGTSGNYSGGQGGWGGGGMPGGWGDGGRR